MYLSKLVSQIIVCALMASTFTLSADSQQRSRPVRQSAGVIEAYRVCDRFQKILSERLDFARAYEATFPTSIARRRAIAIKDGEFGDIDFSGVDDLTLIDAYKSRMQLAYLMLPLASPDSNEEEALFFPPAIKEIFDRKAPHTSEEFRPYSVQLKQDVTNFRAHLDRLAAQYPAVQDRIRKFKADVLSSPVTPPLSHVVKPLQYFGGSDVMSKGESYYEIEGYTVVREYGQMRIAGIRFFTRLF